MGDLVEIAQQLLRPDVEEGQHHADGEGRQQQAEQRAPGMLQERQAALGFLKRSYQDILETFDPKVVKLRKKRKIILSDDAAKDLL